MKHIGLVEMKIGSVSVERLGLGAVPVYYSRTTSAVLGTLKKLNYNATKPVKSDVLKALTKYNFATEFLR